MRQIAGLASKKDFLPGQTHRPAHPCWSDSGESCLSGHSVPVPQHHDITTSHCDHVTESALVPLEFSGCREWLLRKCFQESHPRPATLQNPGCYGDRRLQTLEGGTCFHYSYRSPEGLSV